MGEKSSLLEGMQELLCESRVLQEAWGPCRSLDAGQGLRMTHPFLEEKQVSEKPSQGEQGGKGGGW